ncbi:hypothetical protein [Lysobacter sp. CA199]|uniref:hypothetical protein n=1 Tax=Lysobacter sp. CA199 TaxID=3455608 RepID=UPI003F8D0CE8
MAIGIAINDRPGVSRRSPIRASGDGAKAGESKTGTFDAWESGQCARLMGDSVPATHRRMSRGRVVPFRRRCRTGSGEESNDPGVACGR